jgi:hypothetical protein
LFLLNRSKKKAIDILSIPSAAIAEMIDWQKDAFSKITRSALETTLE